MTAKRPEGAPKQPSRFTQHEAAEFRRAAQLRCEYKLEALKLYRPLPTQEDYHACRASEVLLIGGVRAGKSLAAFAEDARAVTGQDPYEKYPKTDGNLVIVGQNWKQVGLVIYPMLFKAGAFAMIRDLVTGKWRSYNPLDPEDRKRKAETKPAPPLIPQRWIKSDGMSFINKREKHISTVELTTGWTIHVFSSDGVVPQGFKANRVHIDEDVNDESWVHEMESRLSDVHGVLHWSAMPHGENDALMNLQERAEKQADEKRKNPDVVMFRLDFLGNPYIDQDEKDKRVEGWAAQGEDILNMRLRGEVGLSSRMYPQFHPSIYAMDLSELPNREVPHDWCRYMVVDPGSQVCAVLFAVVPPPKIGDFVLLEHELYLQQANANTFAEAVARYLEHRSCRAFIIDEHGGRLKDIGVGRSVKSQYSMALKLYGVQSEITSHNFIGASDDVEGRCEAVRLWLHSRRDGTRKLRVLRDGNAPVLPHFERTMRNYRRKIEVVNGTKRTVDKPNARGDVHMAQLLEYLAAYDPKYRRPKPIDKPKDFLRGYLNEKRSRNRPQRAAVALSEM